MTAGVVLVSSSPLITPAGVINVGPFSINLAAPVGDATDVTFTVAGFKQVTFPTTTSMVIIVPPPGNNSSLQLCGNNTDQGVHLDTVNPSFLSILAGGTFIWLGAPGACGPFRCLFL